MSCCKNESCAHILNNVIPVMHHVMSAHRLIDFARIVYGFGFKNLVITKVSGSAAQQGVPEVFRLSMKYGSSLVVLPDLKDVVELVKPDKIYFLSQDGSKTMSELLEELSSSCNRVALVASGLDVSFTPKELELGESVKVLNKSLGGIGLMTVALYELYNKFCRD